MSHWKNLIRGKEDTQNTSFSALLFFHLAHLFPDEKMITRDCWMGTGVSQLWFRKGSWSRL
jgi:hypothetical protein